MAKRLSEKQARSVELQALSGCAMHQVAVLTADSRLHLKAPRIWALREMRSRNALYDLRFLNGLDGRCRRSICVAPRVSPSLLLSSFKVRCRRRIMQYHLAKTATFDAQIMTVSMANPPNDHRRYDVTKKPHWPTVQQRGFRCNILAQRDHYKFPTHTANAIQWLI